MDVEVKIKLDIKLIKKALILIEEDVPSDDEIINKITNDTVDLTGPLDEDGQNAALAVALLSLGAFQK